MNNENIRQVSEPDGPGEVLKPGALGYNTPPAPSREGMLAAVYAQAGPQENTMTFVSRIFQGRRWYVQTAVATLLLCAAALVWSNAFKPTYSYAQETPGYVLRYDLGQASPPAEGQDNVEDSRVRQIEETLHNWAKERKAQAEAAGENYDCKISISISNKNGALSMSIGAAGAGPETLDEIRQLLATIPGLPEPQVEDATWFSDGPLSMDGGLQLSVDGHLFSFGPGFTEEQIAETLNKWLAENKPGSNAKVVVNKSTDAEGREQMRIEVRIHDGESEDGSAPAGS
jgi:hypothetical protein